MEKNLAIKAGMNIGDVFFIEEGMSYISQYNIEERSYIWDSKYPSGEYVIVAISNFTEGRGGHGDYPGITEVYFQKLDENIIIVIRLDDWGRFNISCLQFTGKAKVNWTKIDTN